MEKHEIVLMLRKKNCDLLPDQLQTQCMIKIFIGGGGRAGMVNGEGATVKDA